MKMFVAGMVIYPPEPRFPRERKHLTIYEIDENDAPTECYTIKYEHHHWASATPLRAGMKCFCGNEEIPYED